MEEERLFLIPLLQPVMGLGKGSMGRLGLGNVESIEIVEKLAL